MCCPTHYCLYTYLGIWTLLPPSPLWVTSPFAQWVWPSCQIWVAVTGTCIWFFYLYSELVWCIGSIKLYVKCGLELSSPQVVEDVTPILYSSPEPKVRWEGHKALYATLWHSIIAAYICAEQWFVVIVRDTSTPNTQALLQGVTDELILRWCNRGFKTRDLLIY